MSDRVQPTPVGIAVARSGLLPETALYFLNSLIKSSDSLREFMPETVPSDKWGDETLNDLSSNRLDYALKYYLSHLCFSSPEYNQTESPKQRFLPYMLFGNRREPDILPDVEGILAVQPWDRDVASINAASIALDYATGVPLADLESRFEGLSGGVIANMLRDHASHLAGLADILDVVSSPYVHDFSGHQQFSSFFLTDLAFWRKLQRKIRQFIRQISQGVPENALWLREVRGDSNQRVFSRAVAIDLAASGFSQMSDILDAGRRNELHQIFQRHQIGNDLRVKCIVAVENYRVQKTDRLKTRLQIVLPECSDLIGKYFKARNTAFEDCIEEAFNCLGISIFERDDGIKSRFPDFVFGSDISEKIILECKSKNGNGTVSLGDATDVGGKATAHGLNSRPMISVCQPYVDSDVARKIEHATSLSVLDAEDFAFALVYLRKGTLSLERFLGWVTTPGQPRTDDLFH